LPSPTRAAIEANPDREWHLREGEAAMTEPVRDPTNPPRISAEPPCHRRATEASTHYTAAKAAAHHPSTKPSAQALESCRA
jgi:hypothetical protein